MLSHEGAISKLTETAQPRIFMEGDDNEVKQRMIGLANIQISVGQDSCNKAAFPYLSAQSTEAIDIFI